MADDKQDPLDAIARSNEAILRAVVELPDRIAQQLARWDSEDEAGEMAGPARRKRNTREKKADEFDDSEGNPNFEGIKKFTSALHMVADFVPFLSILDPIATGIESLEWVVKPPKPDKEEKEHACRPCL